MKFTEILEELRKCKKVTREKWEECKTECYKYIKLEHGEIIAYLKDDNGEDKVEERTKCMFEIADFTAEDWKIYKEPTKNWEPKEGDIIFYITETGRVISGTFLSLLPSDNDKVLFNNAFQTREEAEHMLEKIKIITKLRELSNTRSIYNQDKFIIYYNFEENKVSCGEINYMKVTPFEVYFKTREDCQKAIETIGEENLKKYYFDILEEDN
jgi:hypothetical protein